MLIAQCYDSLVAGGENLTTLSVEAARKALEMAKVDPGDVDLILVCSSTSDDLFGTGPQVGIGYVNVSFFVINASL